MPAATLSGALDPAPQLPPPIPTPTPLPHPTPPLRPQRVPATESSGRVHTSAASVAVLPQAEDVDVHIRSVSGARRALQPQHSQAAAP